jgi:hypothetical protein
VYDYVVNPGHWTTDMREDALEPAQLNSPDLKARCRACSVPKSASLLAGCTLLAVCTLAPGCLPLLLTLPCRPA